MGVPGLKGLGTKQADDNASVKVNMADAWECKEGAEGEVRKVFFTYRIWPITLWNQFTGLLGYYQAKEGKEDQRESDSAGWGSGPQGFLCFIDYSKQHCPTEYNTSHKYKIFY